MLDMQFHAREVRERLRNPPNAVPDPGIDLKRKLFVVPSVEIAPKIPSPPSYDQLTEIKSTMAWHYAQIELLQQEYGLTLERAASKRLKVSTIIRVVAAHYGRTKIDICSPRREQSLCDIRHTAMYLAKTLTELSLPAIGRWFGDRDHTTVLHAVRKTKSRRETNPEFDADLKMFEAKLSTV